MKRNNYNYLSDLIAENGFFKSFNTLYSTDFQYLFGENLTADDIEIFDNIVLDSKGDKTLTNFYQRLFDSTTTTKSAIVTMIVKKAYRLFGENWKSIKDSIDKIKNMNIESPISYTKEITQDIDGENGNTNKVYAYDSENAVNDSANTSTEDKTIETTETKNSSGNRLPSEVAEKQFDFIKYNNLLEIIIDDFVNICCLNIYD